MVVAQSGALRSDMFPNSRLRVAVGGDGGTERSDSGAAPFWTFNLGWLVGVDGGRPKRSDSGATWPEFRGGGRGWRWHCLRVGKNRKGEKRLRPTYAGVSAERQTLRPRTTTAMRTTAPRSRQGARPARQESAHGYNPKRRRACLCGGASRRGRHQYGHAGRGGNDEGAKHDAL